MTVTKGKKSSKSLRKQKKEKLLAYQSTEHKIKYHPLKRKKVKTEKIKYVIDIPLDKKEEGDILSKRYYSDILHSRIDCEDVTGREYAVIEWLRSLGEDVYKAEGELYSLNGNICSFGYVFIYANKKRYLMKLRPFFINWISES